MVEWYEEFGAPIKDPEAYKKWLADKRAQESKKRIYAGMKTKQDYSRIFVGPDEFVQCKCSEYTDTPKVSEETMKNALQVIFAEFAREKVLPHVDWEEFKRGFPEELEHGCRNPATNITCDDPVATAKIVLAHLNEEPDYYTRHHLGVKELPEWRKDEIKKVLAKYGLEASK